MKLKIGKPGAPKKAKQPKKGAPAKAKRHAFKVGSKFRCDDCGHVHTLMPCSNPDYDFLFYYCQDRLQLATLDRWSFI